MQARKCRKQIYVFTFLSVTVRKAKFRRKFLSHILKPCGRHRADSESVACHVPCVFGVTVITVILGKCVRRGGGGHELCTFACDYSDASLSLAQCPTESFAPAVARLQRLISREPILTSFFTTLELSG